MKVEDKKNFIQETKQFRRELDGILQRIKGSDRSGRERSLAVTKVQEAIMWLGMDLKDINEGVTCYPAGYDPDSPTVEPTADGLRM